MNKSIFITAFICTNLTGGFLPTPTLAQNSEMRVVKTKAIAQNLETTTNTARTKTQADVTKTLIILGLILGMGTLGWYLFRRSVAGSSFVTGGNNNSNTSILDRVNPRLKRKLLRLINDPKTANRLLVGIHKHNRDRSANWLAEKAIYDLQRGR